MKRFSFLLMALAGTFAFGSYAQTDSVWIQATTERLITPYPYFADYINAPTNGFVYVQEFSYAKGEDINNRKFTVLEGDQTLELDRTVEQGIFSHFVYVVRKDTTVQVSERPEMDMEFSNYMSNAYDTVYYSDFSEDLHRAVSLTAFFSNQEVHKIDDNIPLTRGGEYDLSIGNNIGNGHDLHLTVTSEPACKLDINENAEVGFMMSSLAKFNVFIASGYPYADRLSDYQNSEMTLNILDANNDEVYEGAVKLEASADRLLLEYVVEAADSMIVASPKYTFRFSGPLLTDDIVITKEALPNFFALNDAIQAAEQLSDSIMNDPELVDFIELATQLKEAAEAAKECLTLTAYEQNQIDEAAIGLKLAIDAVLAALDNRDDDVTAIENLLEATSKVADKRLVNGLLLINHNGITYDARGIK